MEPPRFFWGGGRLFISSHRLAFEGDASSLVFVSVRMRLQLGFINVCVHFWGGLRVYSPSTWVTLFELG